MKQFSVSLVLVAAMASLVVVGCGQAAPAPAPTKAPAAAPAAPTKAPEPAKAAEPTKAPAAPTAAPAAPKVDYPQKGRAITFIVPYSAGGATDLITRAMGSAMEKDLGASFQVVNKAGASSQVGTTELANARPDGYTIEMVSMWTVLTTYLDADRKAAYTRKDLKNVAGVYSTPYVISVKADSPYKTVKELLDAAKAAPDKIKAGTTGRLGMGHLGTELLAKMAGVKFSAVHFDGGAPEMVALLGGHIDFGINPPAEVMAAFKGNQIRVLGITTPKESPLFPGVKTMESQGYNLNMASVGNIIAPRETPNEMVNILSASAKKAVVAPEVKKVMDDNGFDPFYQDPAEAAKFWDGQEAIVKPVLEDAKKDQ